MTRIFDHQFAACDHVTIHPSIQDEATVKVAAYQMPTQAIMRPGPNHDDAAKAGSPNYMARFIGPSPQVTKGALNGRQGNV